MKTHLDKAIESIRERIDKQEFDNMVCSAMYERIPFSYIYQRETEEIVDALEEYGQDNCLPEGWWLEHGDVNDIIEML